MATIDKRTIGLTQSNKKVIEKLIEKYYFKEQMDVAKFAMSIAIQRGVQIGNAEGTDTTWNIGSFDSDGEIRSVIMALYPEITTPYRVIEFLYNEGLKYLGEQLESNPNLDIDKLLEG